MSDTDSYECRCRKVCPCEIRGKRKAGKEESRKLESLAVSSKSPSISKQPSKSEKSASIDFSVKGSSIKPSEESSIKPSEESSKKSSKKSSLKSASSERRSSTKASSKSSVPIPPTPESEKPIDEVKKSDLNLRKVSSIYKPDSKLGKTSSIQVKRKETDSYVTFTSSSSDESALTLRSSFFESSFDLFKDLESTKVFLKTGLGVTVYDHLAEVVHKIVGNRIQNSVNFIESISKDVKDERLLNQGDHFRDVYKKPNNFCEVQRLNSLYKHFNETADLIKKSEIRSNLDEDERSNVSEILSIVSKEDERVRIPNLIESNNLFRQAGYGLPEWEIFDLTVSVMRLVEKMKNIFSKVRFFGKIFGVYKSYYVLETEFTIEEIERCKQIQLDYEQALEASESEIKEDSTERVSKSEGSKSGSEHTGKSQSEEELGEISHEELVRRITKKAREEHLRRQSEKSRHSDGSEKSSSGHTGSNQASSEARSSSVQSAKKTKSSRDDSLRTQAGSLMNSGESSSVGTSTARTTLLEPSETSEEIEIMAAEILQSIIRGILECVAIDMVKLIEEGMPCLPPEPENKWTPPKDVPQEGIGEGLNKTVFWVCNNLEEEWVCLPNVSPKHIDIARKITVGFTGFLEREVKSFPEFDGKEKDYLRAQLARINSSTSVSPLGFYIKGMEGEEIDEDNEGVLSKYGEEEEFDDNYDYEEDTIDIRKNPFYRNRSISQLSNNSLSYWVHHRKEIKKDGRITWWDYDDEQLEDEEIDETGSETGQTVASKTSQSRVPRPLFKPLSREERWNDDEDRVGWNVAKHPVYLNGPTIVALKCLRWPGAVAYASVDGKSDHMYIGWGLKYEPKGYRPLELPQFSLEYPEGEDILEDLDPCVTDEEDQLEEGDPPLRPKKVVPKRDSVEKGEGSEEENGEEEEESSGEQSEELTDSEEE